MHMKRTNFSEEGDGGERKDKENMETNGKSEKHNEFAKWWAEKSRRDKRKIENKVAYKRV